MYNRYIFFLIGIICSPSLLISHEIDELNILQNDITENNIQRIAHKLALIKTAKDLILDMQDKQETSPYVEEQIILHDIQRLMKTLKDLSNYEITEEYIEKQNGHQASAFFSVFSGIFILTNGIFFILKPANKEYIINAAAASVLTTLSTIFSLTYKNHAKAIDAEMYTLINHEIDEKNLNPKNLSLVLTIPRTFFKTLIKSIEACERNHNVNLSHLKQKINDDLQAIEQGLKI